MLLLIFGVYLFMIGICLFSFGLYAKPNKNVILETTLADQYLTDSQVKLIQQGYKKQLRNASLFLLILGLPLFIMPYESIRFVFFFILVMLTFIAFQYILIVNIRRMQTLKQKNNWFVSDDKQAKRRVDTQLSLNKNADIISIWWFLPPFLVGLSQLVWAGFHQVDLETNLILNGIFLLTLLIVAASYWAIYRIPAKLLCDDPTINRFCNKMTKRYWSLSLLSLTYYISLIQLTTTATMTASLFNLMVFSWIIGLATLSLLLGLSYLLFSSRTKQNQALSQASKYYYEDIDQAWQYGIYINPDDPSIMVQDRLGMNMSFNFGNKVARWALIAILVPVLILLIWISSALFQADFSTQSFSLSLSEQTVTLKAPLASTSELSYSEITSVELLEELPQAVRVRGTGTANYATGKFRVTDEKALAIFFIDRRSAKFIKIKTDQCSYYFSKQKTSETEESYHALLAKIN